MAFITDPEDKNYNGPGDTIPDYSSPNLPGPTLPEYPSGPEIPGYQPILEPAPSWEIPVTLPAPTPLPEPVPGRMPGKTGDVTFEQAYGASNPRQPGAYGADNPALVNAIFLQRSKEQEFAKEEKAKKEKERTTGPGGILRTWVRNQTPGLAPPVRTVLQPIPTVGGIGTGAVGEANTAYEKQYPWLQQTQKPSAETRAITLPTSPYGPIRNK